MVSSSPEDTLDRLDQQASAFADLLTGLLNSTIASGASVESFTRYVGNRAVAIVAPGVIEAAPDPPEGLVPISTAAGAEVREQAPAMPPAHVHIHGSSEELAYAYGLLGQRPRPLEKLHVPVGSRRYRPTVEDFIEFLAAHDLALDLHDGW